MTGALPQKILIVRLGAIGDVVNALVLASAIRDRAPETEIGWAVHPLAQPLVDGHPAVNRVHLWEKGGGAAGLRRTISEVRRARYELAIDLQRIAKSSALARLSGAGRVLGFDRGRSKEVSWLWTRERIPGQGDGQPAHMVEQYLDFARYLGIENPPVIHELPADEAAESKAAALVDELGAPPLLLNIGATKPANRWAPERFGELARALIAETDSPIVFTGGPSDRPAADRALTAAGADDVHDMVGKTSLLELVALQRRSRACVTCDTGPMHLAAAVRLPVVALFGAADERRTGPWGERHRVVRTHPPCAPCNARTCPLPRHECMDDLSVEAVIDGVKSVLAQPAPTSGAAS